LEKLLSHRKRAIAVTASQRRLIPGQYIILYTYILEISFYLQHMISAYGYQIM
jgi:hypothetical protein